MSNMVVRTNVFAINAHRNLKNTGLQQQRAAQRLSSGFRINSAADDAAGLAISETMRGQIRGLDQASINTQDGIGLIQTAEGAMSTISDMVIRIRELMVQAANDTNTLGNRDTIQLEIDQIMQEINDVTFRTQFNTRTLLDGGLGGGGGAVHDVSLQWMLFEQARVIGISPSVIDARHNLEPNSRNQNSIRGDVIGIQEELWALADEITNRMIRSDHATMVSFTRPADVTWEQMNQHATSSELAQLRSLANRLNNTLQAGLVASEQVFNITNDQLNALGGGDATVGGGRTVFSRPAYEQWRDENAATLGATYGSEGSGQAIVDNIRNALQIVPDPAEGSIQSMISTVVASSVGQGQFYVLDSLLASLVGTTDAHAIGPNGRPPNVWPTPQTRVLNRDAVGVGYDAAGQNGLVSSAGAGGIPGTIAHIRSLMNHMEVLMDNAREVLSVVNLEANAMWFQIGPNELQGLVLQLQGMHTGILGGPGRDLAMLIDVREENGETISEQLAHIARAEGIVNAQRAQLGAVQNRLEFTRQSLDISSENLQDAESRVRNTDMAREMMRFTAANILQQAGTSMLAQANQLPRMVLELLN